jgi:hypothetical protein
MKVGDKVVGFFGAMLPLVEGEIVKLEDAEYGVAVDVLLEDGTMKYLTDFELRGDFYSPQGSPIGYYRLAETV